MTAGDSSWAGQRLACCHECLLLCHVQWTTDNPCQHTGPCCITLPCSGVPVEANKVRDGEIHCPLASQAFSLERNRS